MIWIEEDMCIKTGLMSSSLQIHAERQVRFWTRNSYGKKKITMETYNGSVLVGLGCYNKNTTDRMA